jgi:hypothetical protein
VWRGHSSSLLTQRSRVRFPVLPDFLSSNRCGTGVHSALVRINEELLERKVKSPVNRTEINDRRGSAALTTRHPSIQLVLNFVDKWRSLSRYRSLGD